MTASELEPLVRVQEVTITHLQQQVEDLRGTQRDTDKELAATKQQLARLEERLANHIAHAEKWDGRRWAMIAAIVGGLAVNVIMLLINRK